MKPVDHRIIAQLRKNARKPIPKISKEEAVPPSTIYEKLKRQYKGLFKGYITLMNFQNLGYNTIMHFAISCNETNKADVKKYLLEHPRINTLYRLSFDWDYLAEGIFKNLEEAEDFKTITLDRFNPIKLECFNMVAELKKEEFLSKPEHFK